MRGSGPPALSASQATFSGAPATHGTPPQRQRRPLTSTSGAEPPARRVSGVSGQVPPTWGGLLAEASVGPGEVAGDDPAPGASVAARGASTTVPTSAATRTAATPIDPRATTRTGPEVEGQKPDQLPGMKVSRRRCRVSPTRVRMRASRPTPGMPWERAAFSSRSASSNASCASRSGRVSVIDAPLPVLGAEGRPQCGSGAVQARLDGAHRAPDHLRDLLQPSALEVVKDEDRPLVDRESTERTGE